MKHQKLTVAPPLRKSSALIMVALFPRRTCCIYSNICHNVLRVTCHWWYSSTTVLVHRMAHWFHRNPLKATAPVSFNYYGVAGSPAANKICKYVTSPLPVQIPLWLTSSAFYVSDSYIQYRCFTACMQLLSQITLTPAQSRRQSLWDNLASLLSFVHNSPVLCVYETQWPADNEGEAAGDVLRCHLQPWDDEKCYRCIFVPTARYGR